jgi:dephospho-CoA kinase
VLVALTGGIASGKSTVAQLFREHGAVVIKADDLAKEVVDAGGRAHSAVLAHFGPQIINPQGQIDRSKLAQIVFNNPEELKTLEQITHPAVQLELADRISVLPKDSIVIYEIPLLIEKNLFSKFDKSIAVIADLDLRKERAIARGVMDTDFDSRVENQTTDELREQLVDYMIYNNGSLSQLAKQVDDIWTKLTS